MTQPGRCGPFVFRGRLRFPSWWFGLGIMLVVGLRGVAAAQVVRGSVVDRASGSPLAGVLVSLQPAQGSAGDTVTVLTNLRGEFALRAVAAGRYRLVAKRIGVRRYESVPFDLAPGEARRVDVALDPVAQLLPEVAVIAAQLCVEHEDRRARTGALWEEARTALLASRVSLRDRLFEGQVRRYTRGLDPRTLRVLEELRTEVHGVLDRPPGLSGDSLSTVGYRQDVDGYAWFHAPDAEVLLSAAFQRDHCFDLADARRDRRGLVGIAFAPGPGRALPDVSGVVWLDARSLALRLVEFRFTGMEPFTGSEHVGGELHFAQLANGAWLLSRWFVRTPEHGRSLAPLAAESRLPSVMVRPTVYRLLEEGGVVESARPAAGR